MTLEEYAERIAREFPAPAASFPDSPERLHWGGGWGMTRPGVTVRLSLPEPAATSKNAGGLLRLALTLDACGGAFDRELIAVLREYDIPATLFVTSLWLRNNRDAARELAADPLFSFQAHGARHLPASVSGRSAYGIQGTGSVRDLVLEVEGNVRDITALTGVRPLWYRSATAHYDDAAVRVIHRLGLRIAGFSRNGDDGATLSADAVCARLLAAKDGDIIFCHMNKPRSGTAQGLRRALPALLEKGALFLHLADSQ